jgi:hypothetical protein
MRNNEIQVGNTINHDDENRMPEWWYIFWWKHEQRSEKIIIPVPPIDAKHMDHEDCCNPNKYR